jgi:hypothetical protein
MRKMNLVRRDDSFSVDEKQRNVGIGLGERMAIHIYRLKNITVGDRATV